MKRFISIFLFLVLWLGVSAATYHASQSGSGTADGSSSGNAASMATLNGRTNSPDDLIILHGTISTTLTIHDSGTSGHPITYQFADSSAKFSKAFWGTTTSAAIYATGKSYITIDGNSVGLIENTANGTGLGNTQASHGIYTTGCSNFITKNLTISNLYVQNSGDANGTSQYTVVGWKGEDCDNLDADHISVDDAYTAFYFPKSASGTKSNFTIRNCTITRCSTPIVIATSTSGAVINAAKVYNNDITMGANWYDPPDFPASNNHIDGIHMWGLSGGSMTNTEIYNNYIHGDPSGYCTGYIFGEGNMGTPLIYNNVLVGATTKPQEGYINIAYNGAGSTPRIYNNTIVGIGTASTGGNGITIDPTNAAMTVYLAGNILTNLYTGYYEPTASSTLTTDKNVYYNLGNTGIRGTSSANLTAWRTATGGEANSSNLTPNISAPYYIPVATSSAIGIGQDNSAYFTTDISGATRSTWDAGAVNSTTSSWTVGAGAGGGDSTAPTVTITVPNSSGSNTQTSAAVTISGTASDNVAVSSVAVVMSGATTGSVTITGTTSWSGSATVNAGATTFTATATDSSSNTGTDTHVTTYTVITPARTRRSSAPVGIPGF